MSAKPGPSGRAVGRAGDHVDSVLHLIDSGGLYGAESVLLALAAEQKRLGCRVTIGSFRAPAEPEKAIELEAARRGFGVLPLPVGNGRHPGGLLQALRHFTDTAYDIVHSHGYKGDVLLGGLPRLSRWPATVSTVHGWTGVAESSSRLKLFEALDAMALARMDSVVAVAESMRTHTHLRRVDPGRLFVIENRLIAAAAMDDSPSDSEGDSEVERFLGSGTTVVAVGRLSREKGFHILIEAVSLVRAAGVDLRLLLLGEGEEHDSLLSQLETLGLRQHVLLPGYVKNAARWIARADIFALSSLTEGMPMVIIEALRAGVPVVATRVGGVPALIGESGSGLLVEPGEPRGLADALEALCRDDALRRSFGAAALESCATGAGDTLGQRYMEVYAHARRIRRGGRTVGR